jgi:hypothetical protein
MACAPFAVLGGYGIARQESLDVIRIGLPVLALDVAISSLPSVVDS